MFTNGSLPYGSVGFLFGPDKRSGVQQSLSAEQSRAVVRAFQSSRQECERVLVFRSPSRFY